MCIKWPLHNGGTSSTIVGVSTFGRLLHNHLELSIPQAMGGPPMVARGLCPLPFTIPSYHGLKVSLSLDPMVGHPDTNLCLSILINTEAHQRLQPSLVVVSVQCIVSPHQSNGATQLGTIAPLTVSCVQQYPRSLRPNWAQASLAIVLLGVNALPQGVRTTPRSYVCHAQE